MKKIATKTAAAACACLALGGCVTLEPPEMGVAPTLQIETVDNRFVVHFETDRDRLDADERRRLRQFVADVGHDRIESAVVIGHADARESDLYNLDLSARRTAGVLQELGAIGLEAQVVDFRALGETQPARRGDDPVSLAANRRVEVVLRNSVVRPPSCGDWSQTLGFDPYNLPLAPLGCVTTANLASMAVRPTDLIRGRTLGPGDAAFHGEGVRRYRADEVKELQIESTN